VKLEIPAEKILPQIEEFIINQMNQVKISNKKLVVEKVEWTQNGLTLTIKD